MATDQATLEALNREYIRSVSEADVGWFDANLSEDFVNSNPDGSLVDRAGFLAQIGRGSTVKKNSIQNSGAFSSRVSVTISTHWRVPPPWPIPPTWRDCHSIF